MNDAADPVENRADLVTAVVGRARAGGTTLATAESCTGGLVAHLLSTVAGVSSVFLGGIVSYSNEAKRDLLGVDAALLEAHGAVSAPVALAMARGARLRLGAAMAVSTTGISGPGGATATKPVGLTYIGLATAQGERCLEFRFVGSRAENQVAAAQAALGLLLEALSTPDD